MPNSKIIVTQGVGTNLATAEITESAEQRHLSRTVINNSAGVEIALLKPSDTLNAVALISDTRQLTAANLNAQVATIAAVIPTATVMQSAAVAVGNGVNLNVQGYASIILNVTGTFVGTITFEASVDDITFVPITGHQVGVAGNLTSTTTTSGDFRISTSAYKSVRARISAYTSGSVTVKGYASAIAGHATTVNANIIAPLPTGSNTVGAITNTGFNVNAMPVDGTVSGNITALSGNLAIDLSGISAASIQITGTFVATLQFEGTLDGTNWNVINAVSASTSSPQPTTTTTGLYRLTPAGLSRMRVTCTAFTSGTVAIIIRTSVGTGGVFVNQVLPVRSMLDSNRTPVTISLDSFNVAATTETLNTMSYSNSNGTPTTNTSYAVTAGKKYFMQAIHCQIHTIAGNTTAVNVIVRLRINNSGAAIVTSPMQFITAIQGVATANGAGIEVTIPLPNGYEVVGGAGIGVTTTCAGFVATTAAPKVDISIIGFEY